MKILENFMTTGQQPDASVTLQNDAIASNAVPRENMIATAIRFLQNPQVRSGPLSQKKAFLQKKGLTTQEMEIAIDRSGTRQDVVPAAAPVQTPSNQSMFVPPPGIPMKHQQMVPYGQPVPPRLTSWRDYTAIAVIIGGMSYGVYKLIQNFLMPFLRSRKEEQERLDKLEAAVQELNKSVLLTVEKLETKVTSVQGLLEQQQVKLDSLTASVVTTRAITSSSSSTEIADVKAEITSLKGLLLNRHQFPATPQPSPIPSWQRVNPATDSTPRKPLESQPQQTADQQTTDQQTTGTKTATANILNASEVGVTNGDLGVVNHSEGVANDDDETLDMNIHENGTALKDDTAGELANQMDVAQAT
ncbi:peroxisomal membrane protein PEX14-like isoform X2 [Patiria miniata]|uniref:Peroxisomal membrane protein PEX14 n=1 Tax=Patiria miniata TaxID=46514 RepID=A0A914AB99_PATMI|nr:peroxisomal membrane protein PEX14-like isoform X2 [Patiria miniata]